MDISYKGDKSNVTTEVKLPKIQGIVYEAISQNPGLRTPAISSLTNLNTNRINNAIKALRAKNLIKYLGSKKEGGYFINTTE